MKTILALATGAALMLGGCTPEGRTAVGGAAAGGVIGAAAGGAFGGSRSDILIGAGLGATAGAIIAANNPRPSGYCTYRDRNTGELYYAPCPRS
jgi:hypothetical protein